MKCDNENCTDSFSISEAETELEYNYVELMHVDLEEIEITVTISISVNCPDCGDKVMQLDGEIGNMALDVQEVEA